MAVMLSGWEPGVWRKVMAAYCWVYDYVTCTLTAYDRDQLQTQRWSGADPLNNKVKVVTR